MPTRNHWFKCHGWIAEYSKVFELARVLGEPMVTAVGRVTGMLCWASSRAPDGLVHREDGYALETRCWWGGEPGALLAVLVAVGLLAEAEGGWQVDPGLQWQGSQAKDAERQRRRRSRLNGSEGPMSRDSHVTVTLQSRDIGLLSRDIELPLEIEKAEKKQGTRQKFRHVDLKKRLIQHYNAVHRRQIRTVSPRAHRLIDDWVAQGCTEVDLMDAITGLKETPVRNPDTGGEYREFHNAFTDACFERMRAAGAKKREKKEPRLPLDDRPRPTYSGPAEPPPAPAPPMEPSAAFLAMMERAGIPREANGK